MAFDQINMNGVEVRVNGYKYPQADLKCDFSKNTEDYSDAYQRFLHLGYKYRNIDGGTVVNNSNFNKIIDK